MLVLELTPQERFNDATQEFYISEAATLRLEHSLLSISEWESKWNLPFFSPEKKTSEQTLDYVRMMVVGEPPQDRTFKELTGRHFQEVSDYISSDRSALVFKTTGRGRGRGEDITSELVYYWMIASGIPFEAERWHFNRLLNLIQLCQQKSKQQNKGPTGSGSIKKRNRDLNALRRQQLGTSG